MRARGRAHVLALLVLALALALAGAVAAPVPGAVAASAAASTAADESPLVVVGAPGLAWSDLDRDDLPALGRLAGEGAVGSLTVRAVRSRACAVDGWLTLSAGRRAADRPGPCREPAPVGAGAVPRWGEYLAAATTDSYDARPGTLGAAVTASGGCIETVGPGAAIAGADRGGTVTQHHADAVPPTFSCPVVLVDAGVLPAEDGPLRRAAVARLDGIVDRVLSTAPGADVVVAGVGDGDSPVRPRAVLAGGPSFGAGLLGSASTRQPGVAQLQDLTATALARVGAGTEGVTGRVLTVDPAGGRAAERVAQRVAERVGFETRAATLRSVSPQVTGWLAAAYVLWAGVVAGLWWRRGAGTALPGPVLAAGVAVAAVPVGTFVANLVPWWRSPAPEAGLVVVLVAVVVALSTAAMWAERHRPLGALRLVAVVTLLVLAGDVLLGSRLQLGSVFGQNPVVGGRFYGLGNTSFALYGLAVLVVVGWTCAAASRSRSRSASAALGLGVLATFLAIEALPRFGADFGGPPGLLLGGLVVVAAALGVRLTPRRVLSAVAGAALLVTLVAWLDWRRPADARSHLGEFVETVASGEVGAVLGRKLAQNVANLGSPPLLAIALTTVVLVLVAWRTGWRPVPHGAVVLRGAAVLALVGFAVNDSGLVIPAFVAVVLAPLLVAAGPTERGGPE
ncbi:hypothetical protein GCM10023168_09250 [Fodinibacter luteus]|uniref:Uncharacterized protein n=1 Tax=Fodinibacter luteus TaxID=552064 RepID=A0ABP8K4X1_9MICO